MEYRAKTFVLASGYAWSPHLLLLSGVANSSGLVGKYMTGHAFIGAQIELDATLYPGMNEQHSLISRKFFRCATSDPFVRHDLRVWESSAGRDPRLKDAAGKLLLGDALLEDWRARTARGAARVRAYYDVHPSADSPLTLDPSKKNRWGDPLPQIRHALDEATKGRAAATREHILGVFNQLAKANNGRVFNVSEGNYLDHPAGGCRMGTDPAASVCDSYRPHARPREPVRGGIADAADRRVHERDAHLRGADAAFCPRHRENAVTTSSRVRRSARRASRPCPRPTSRP